LLRYFTDEGYQGLFDGGGVVDAGAAVSVGSSNFRPFLINEQTFPVTVNTSGTDSRGIAIDPTQRRACELALPAGTPTTDPRYIECAQLPARVFIANRAPASLIYGQIGALNSDGVYDPDALSLSGSIPLTTGPSNVYLAPIVDTNGHYALQVFVVCFDSQLIYVIDPEQLSAGSNAVVAQIRTGPGPYAMAFDPFDLDAVATNAAVPFDSRSQTTIQATAQANDPLNGKPALRTFRFAYVASFTDSFVQVLDLDQSFHDDRLGDQSTFETIVYTLGVPTQPVGSQ
jgi:DNA-binding beta-propeller fold protein YncE